jgi:hypothetical protein
VCSGTNAGVVVLRNGAGITVGNNRSVTQNFKLEIKAINDAPYFAITRDKLFVRANGGWLTSITISNPILCSTGPSHSHSKATRA